MNLELVPDAPDDGQLSPRMVGSRVLVRPLARRETTRSGLILPSTNSKVPGTEGVVVAIGQGILTPQGVRVPLMVRVGDHVLIGPRAVEVELDEERYFVVDEGDILVVL